MKPCFPSGARRRVDEYDSRWLSPDVILTTMAEYNICFRHALRVWIDSKNNLDDT